ncbi:MAG: hypothetical protein ACOYXO_07695 [Chloroflexota bacterium]
MAIDGILKIMENQQRSVQKVVRIRSLYAPKEDADWWRSQPYTARLAALEEIRQEVHRWKYGTQPRFQRVCRVVKSGRFQDLADLENLEGKNEN